MGNKSSRIRLQDNPTESTWTKDQSATTTAHSPMQSTTDIAKQTSFPSVGSITTEKKSPKYLYDPNTHPSVPPISPLPETATIMDKKIEKILTQDDQKSEYNEDYRRKFYHDILYSTDLGTNL